MVASPGVEMAGTLTQGISKSHQLMLLTEAYGSRIFRSHRSGTIAYELPTELSPDLPAPCPYILCYAERLCTSRAHMLQPSRDAGLILMLSTRDWGVM